MVSPASTMLAISMGTTPYTPRAIQDSIEPAVMSVLTSPCVSDGIKKKIEQWRQSFNEKCRFNCDTPAGKHQTASAIAALLCGVVRPHLLGSQGEENLVFRSFTDELTNVLRQVLPPGREVKTYIHIREEKMAEVVRCQAVPPLPCTDMPLDLMEMCSQAEGILSALQHVGDMIDALKGHKVI